MRTLLTSAIVCVSDSGLSSCTARSDKDEKEDGGDLLVEVPAEERLQKSICSVFMHIATLWDEESERDGAKTM